MSLTFGRRGPDRARALVVFVHGYGANGADLLGLAEPLAPHMPGVAFVAPDAPEISLNNPMGFQWFPVPWLDGSAPEEAEASLRRSAADLDAFLDERMEEEGVEPADTVLLGFSQGTMMSLHVAPRREAAVAAVVGFSGRLLHPESVAAEVVSRPPVLLIHGDLHEMVRPSSMPDAADGRGGLGFEVFAHVSRGTAHGIAPDGLGVALAFMRERLGLE